ncbi:MAG TPA: amidohydrolase family protein [Brumimicrobium sp.]|nr:amidohydrolase family protein [Brumimicrobium sp.]
MLKIDTHTHILPAQLPKWTNKFGYGDFIYLKSRDDGKKDMIKGNDFFRTIEENCWDEEVRIKEYEAFNTQVQVVCTVPVMFSYWAKPNDGLAVSQFLNDHIVELCTRYPKNYIGLGTVPMQDTELAVQELERIQKLGMKGIQIGSNINGLNLSEERFFPIFEACERLNLSIMIHPWNMMGFDEMKKYWLPWLVGMPAETSHAACSMIFSGIFEKLPKLRVLFSHAGGSFFPTIGRIEHGYNCRPDLVAIDNEVNPREYLGKFWADCITHDIDLLKYILNIQGSKKICLGSDYPFPLGDLEIGKFIDDSDLSQEVKENIFANSAIEWLNLNKNDYL